MSSYDDDGRPLTPGELAFIAYAAVGSIAVLIVSVLGLLALARVLS